MNIRGLYGQNGNRAGFWVQHRNWKNLCAQVRSVDGKEIGALTDAPQGTETPVAVEASCFDVRSGRSVPIEDSLNDASDKSFTMIAAPAWSHPRNGQPYERFARAGAWALREVRQ